MNQKILLMHQFLLTFVNAIYISPKMTLFLGLCYGTTYMLAQIFILGQKS